MHIVYLDESGIGLDDQVTICAGVIVSGDNEWISAKNAADEVINLHVPIDWIEGFYFHATDIWNSKKYREKWCFEERLVFLKEMMSIPKRLGLGISIGMCRRGDPSLVGISHFFPTIEVARHFSAFHMCLAKSDQYVRAYHRPNEIAIAIAEDCPQSRRYLRAAKSVQPLVLEPEMLRASESDLRLGCGPTQQTLRIERMIDRIHFVEGNDAPLLQLADACAFGLRRYFARQSYGDDFAQSILADLPDLSVWSGWQSGSVYSFAGRELRGK